METNIWIAIGAFAVTVLANVAYLARWTGKISAGMKAIDMSIVRLEKKQDKHNDFVIKITENTKSTESAHHRIDELKKRG